MDRLPEALVPSLRILVDVVCRGRGFQKLSTEEKRVVGEFQDELARIQREQRQVFHAKDGEK